MGGRFFLTILFLCNFFVCQPAENLVANADETVTFAGKTQPLKKFFSDVFDAGPEGLESRFAQIRVFGYDPQWHETSLIAALKNYTNNTIRRLEIKMGLYLFISNFSNESAIILGTCNKEDAYKILAIEPNQD